MLLASARHPAMMRYLDNASSQKRSVNENYGRELLELHTVGRDAGYTEVDVRNSAYILTGRTVNRQAQFTYEARRHWTGEVKVMDFTNPNGDAAAGMDLGDAYVRYLAFHPATATRIAHKLARRFVCDDPPQTLVDRLNAVLSGQWLGGRADAAHAVQLGRVLDVQRPQDPPPAGERGRHRPHRRRHARATRPRRASRASTT